MNFSIWDDETQSYVHLLGSSNFTCALQYHSYSVLSYNPNHVKFIRRLLEDIACRINYDILKTPTFEDS